jgi:hypothetical protein
MILSVAPLSFKIIYNVLFSNEAISQRVLSSTRSIGSRSTFEAFGIFTLLLILLSDSSIGSDIVEISADCNGIQSLEWERNGLVSTPECNYFWMIL